MAIKNFENLPFDGLMTYAGVDAIVTLDILKQMWPKISATPEYTEYYGRNMSRVVRAPSILSELVSVKSNALRFIVDMEVAGIKYDVEGNRAMAREMSAELRELEEKIFAALGREINLNSDAELGKLLYGEMGMVPPVKTKSGEASVNSDALKSLQKTYGHEWLGWIDRRKNVNSVYSSFIANYVDDWVKKDGCIHPEYNLHGTSSHRISSDNPNLLNAPRPDSCRPYDIRKLYTVKDGYVFLTLDFSSCEVKVLAALCRDERMLEAILAGKDFHTYTASLINNLTYEEIIDVLSNSDSVLDADPVLKALYRKYKSMRQAAKAVTFGILYGSSVFAIAMLLGISEAEAQNLVNAYFDSFPRIKDFVDNSHKMAKHNYFVYSPFGQRKMEYGAMSMYRGTAVHNASLRNAQNVRIQGPASTLGLLAFSKLNDELKKIGGGAMCTVYDSVECFAPFDRVAEAVELGFYCMDDWPKQVFDWLDFSIGADAEIGFDWGESLKKVHRGVSQEECYELLRAANEQRFLQEAQRIGL